MTTYTWDAMGRMQAATTPTDSITYAYDHDGRRVQQTVNGALVTNTLWDEFSAYGDVLLETDASNTLLMRYTLGGSDLIAQTSGGAAHFYLADAQNSTRLLTDSLGNVSDTYSYTAYGELLTQSGTTTNSYRYTGQQHDSLTGLYHLRARQYDPAVGRFLSIDRYPLVIGNPQEHNRYVYVANNPIRYFDPSGFGMVELAIQTIEQIKAHPELTLLGAGVACALRRVATSFPGADIYWLRWLPDDLCTSSAQFDFPTTFPNIPVDIPGFNDFFPDGSDFGFPNIDGFPSNPGLDLPNILGFPMQPWSPWWMLPFIPPLIDNNYIFTSSGPGAWVEVNEAMSERARQYQAQVGGRLFESYVVNGVKFDGWLDEEGVLIEAKSFYEQFLKANGEFWAENVSDGLLNQAIRQIEASQGTPIHWIFAEQKVADAVEELFLENNIDIEIKVELPNF